MVPGVRSFSPSPSRSSTLFPFFSSANNSPPLAEIRLPPQYGSQTNPSSSLPQPNQPILVPSWPSPCPFLPTSPYTTHLKPKNHTFSFTPLPPMTFSFAHLSFLPPSLLFLHYSSPLPLPPFPPFADENRPYKPSTPAGDKDWPTCSRSARTGSCPDPGEGPRGRGN